MKKEIITFIKQKDYKLLKELGQGGLGKTILILDQEMGEQFVCKKYSPYDDSIKDEYYEYFKNEIKVMYQVFHANIVRIFNYYMYPEQKTGYILMEYVDGKDIYQYIRENPWSTDSIFEQIIGAFTYLENLQILHRDIRRENILVANDGQVKIIDFGFGKKVKKDSDKKKSISLNWWCEVPSEFQQGVYDHCTEIYFIGKLFESILFDGNDEALSFDFKHNEIIKKMIKYDPNERYRTFSEIKINILEHGIEFDDLFTYDEKETYKAFINQFVNAIAEIDESTKYNTDLTKVISDFDNIYRQNILEDEIQNIRDVTRIFLNGTYTYYNIRKLSKNVFRDMLRMLKSANIEKTNILMLNIQNRLNQVVRSSRSTDDDIPF